MEGEINGSYTTEQNHGERSYLGLTMRVDSENFSRMQRVDDFYRGKRVRITIEHLG
jgi:hypothetical protein